MATIRLIPSTYYLSNSSYLSVSSASNMYANTDSTNYATVTNSRNSTSSYYIYVRGFNFDAVPADAIINSFTIKLKGNYSGGYSQVMYLYDGTSTSMGTSENSFSSTVTTHTFEPTKSWEDIVAAGSDFGIRINCRRSSRNTTAYIYIYGAEIEVDYTLPVYHTVSITNNTSIEVSPDTTQTLLEGANQEISLFTESVSNLTVTDNNVDVTSQLVRQSAGARTTSADLSGFDGTNSTVSDSGNVGGSDSSTYAQFFIGQQENTYAIWSFDTSAIPADATINSVACEVTAYYNGTSSNVTTRDVQLYSGTTPKGGVSELPTSSSSTRTFSLSPGSWTRAELENIKLRFDGYYNGTYSTYYFHIYGATLTIGYTIDEAYYTYTISNITADHTILVVSSGGLSYTIYAKVNGVWRQATKVLVKRNGSWVEASDVLAKDNGTWK